MSINTAFILDFYKDEDFAGQKDTLVTLPRTLFELVTQATPENIDELWEILIDEDELPAFYEELVEEVMDMSDDDSHFNGGEVRYAHGDNVLVVTVDPSDVHGVKETPKLDYTDTRAVMMDLGNYGIAVKFYILDTDAEDADALEDEQEFNDEDED